MNIGLELVQVGQPAHSRVQRQLSPTGRNIAGKRFDGPELPFPWSNETYVTASQTR